MAGTATADKLAPGKDSAGPDRPPTDRRRPASEPAAGDAPAADLAASGAAAARRMARAAPDADARFDAVRQVAHSVAHDFNNVLAAVIGNLHLVRRRIGGDAAVLRMIGQAIDAATRGSDLSNRLQAFANGPGFERRRVDVNAVVGGMDGALQRTAGQDIAVTMTLADDLPPVETDPEPLESAVLALAANARDAMAGGGTLTVETARVAIDDAGAAGDSMLAAGIYVAISIGDSGRGMAPDLIERAFEPFFSTRLAGKGSGLGLSQVSDFVRRSNGHLTVASRPGAGTRVRMLLPAAHGETHR